MAMNPAWSCQHFGVGWTRTRQERKKNNNKGSEDGDGCRVGRRMVLLRPLSLLLHAALVSLQAFFTLLTARRLFLFLSWEGEQEEGHSPAEGETLGLGDAWALLQNLCLVSGFCLHHSATRPSVVLSLSTTAEWADTYYKIAYAAGTNVAIVVRRRKKKFGCKKKKPRKNIFSSSSRNIGSQSCPASSGAWTRAHSWPSPSRDCSGCSTCTAGWCSWSASWSWTCRTSWESDPSTTGSFLGSSSRESPVQPRVLTWPARQGGDPHQTCHAAP